MRAQRGFTLIETIVVVAILAVLAMVAVISLAQRPGSLAAAMTGYDASLDATRAIAATSGNGATMVFASRTSGSKTLPGFTLTVYRGRPTADNAVTATTVVAVTSDASVREATLGAPTFAIFLSSAGHASGQAAYPMIDSHGVATFATIATQPACPPGGFMLIFSDEHASQTRTLQCRVSVVSTPGPLASMAPSAIVLTPSSLTYDWPGAAQQHFVATEWGYTRWFAARDWSCGSDIAAFATSPAPPYSAAYSSADQDAVPQAPTTLPYSFANSSESMEDAPAWFYLAPQTGGICTATISDANAQSSTLAVDVMGQLVAAPATLSWPTPKIGNAQTVTLSKQYDPDILVDAIGVLSCSGIVTVSNAGAPTNSGDTAAQVVSVVPVQNSKGQNVGGTCTLSFTSQYVGEPPTTVAVNVTSPPTQTMATWPAAVAYGVSGGQITVGLATNQFDLAELLNGAMGGGVVRASESCSAVALTAGNIADPNPPPWVTNSIANGGLGVWVDSSGCFDGSMFIDEPSGVAATFLYNDAPCASFSILTPTTWSPGQTGVRSALGIAPGSTPGSCMVTMSDGSNASPAPLAGSVQATVVGCAGAVGLLLFGESCDLSYALSPGQTGQPCDPDGGDSGTATITYFFTLGGAVPAPAAAVTSTANATLSGSVVTRTAPGTITITQVQYVQQPGYSVNKVTHQVTCIFTFSHDSAGSYTIN